MFMDNNEHQFLYPKKELLDIIQKLNKGITPLIPEDELEEAKLLMRQMEAEDDEDDEELLVEVEKHKRMVALAEKEKHKATKRDAYVYTMTEEQLKKIEYDMSAVYVREDPNSVYNKDTIDVNMSEERREIMQKLSKLRNCYYNQKDYREAIDVIRQAIELSLKNDYPWMTYEEAVKAFNRGEIEYGFGEVPKIYLNYITPVTDPKIAAQIYSGEIELKDKNEKPKKKKRDKNEKGVFLPVSVIPEAMSKRALEYHMKGFDTPLSAMFKMRNTAYGRYSMPTSSYFNNSESEKRRRKHIQETLDNFDWSREGAGDVYTLLSNGKTPFMSDYAFIQFLQEKNGTGLNTALSTNLNILSNCLKGGNSGYSTRYASYETLVQQPNQMAMQQEQALLEAIREANE